MSIPKIPSPAPNHGGKLDHQKMQPPNCMVPEGAEVAAATCRVALTRALFSQRKVRRGGGGLSKDWIILSDLTDRSCFCPQIIRTCAGSVWGPGSQEDLIRLDEYPPEHCIAPARRAG